MAHLGAKAALGGRYRGLPVLMASGSPGILPWVLPWPFSVGRVSAVTSHPFCPCSRPRTLRPQAVCHAPGHRPARLHPVRHRQHERGLGLRHRTRESSSCGAQRGDARRDGNSSEPKLGSCKGPCPAFPKLLRCVPTWQFSSSVPCSQGSQTFSLLPSAGPQTRRAAAAWSQAGAEQPASCFRAG